MNSTHIRKWAERIENTVYAYDHNNIIRIERVLREFYDKCRQRNMDRKRGDTNATNANGRRKKRGVGLHRKQVLPPLRKGSKQSRK